MNEDYDVIKIKNADFFGLLNKNDYRYLRLYKEEKGIHNGRFVLKRQDLIKNYIGEAILQDGFPFSYTGQVDYIRYNSQYYDIEKKSAKKLKNKLNRAYRKMEKKLKEDILNKIASGEKIEIDLKKYKWLIGYDTFCTILEAMRLKTNKERKMTTADKIRETAEKYADNEITFREFKKELAKQGVNTNDVNIINALFSKKSKCILYKRTIRRYKWGNII